MLLKNLRRERGETLLEIAAWGAAFVLVLGISSFVVLRARSQSSAASLTPEQQAYVKALATQQAQAYAEAIATQQAETYINAMATQGAAPGSRAPVPAVATVVASAPAVATVAASAPTVGPSAPPPPSPHAAAPTAVPPPTQPPAALRFTADRVRAAVLTHLSFLIHGNYADAVGPWCVDGLFDPQTAMWMVRCEWRIGRAGEPDGAILLVDDGTGHVYCIKGCSFFPLCLPTALGCEWASTVSP
jgi:hypothetical protein